MKIRHILLAIFVAFGLIYVAKSDQAEADRQSAEYCNNVSSGVWPDYKKEFAKYCKKSLTKKNEASKL